MRATECIDSVDERVMASLRIPAIVIAIAAVTLAACQSSEAPVPASQSSPSSQASELRRMIDRFAPTELTVDLSRLSAPDRAVLAKLVEASKIVDTLYFDQVWSGNAAMMATLAKDRTPEGQERYHY